MMISVSGLTGRGMRRANRGIRAAIQWIAAGATLAAAPLPSLLAESFELPGTIPSVVVEQNDLGANDHLSTGLPAASFHDAFSTASCTDSCTTCGEGGCRCGNYGGDPPGFFQKLCGIHDKTGACWVGRADALILWRNAPPDRLLVQNVDLDASLSPELDANQLDSTAAAGPRVSLIRRDNCSGNAWEATYLRAANFRSQRLLPDNLHQIAPPGIYGNKDSQAFNDGSSNLGSRLQSFEFNRLIADGQRLRWLAGFRWVEWQENFSLDTYNRDFSPPDVIIDNYQTDTINSLYGGQIGAELLVLTLPWLRVDSVVKAGAYYNNAVQQSIYTTNEVPDDRPYSVRVGDSPASCGFIGEVGMTGAIPITSCLDFRFGYFALWLSGIAQPTQQLSGQQLVPGEAESGSLATNGGVVVQGVTLGLEGRW